MNRIRLPKPIESYFAFTPYDQTGDYRAFRLHFPYRDGQQIQKLHVEWRVTGTEETIIGASGIAEKQALQTKKLVASIERLLNDENAVLEGDAPIASLRRLNTGE